MNTTNPSVSFDQAAAHRAANGPDWRWKAARLPPSPETTQLLAELDQQVLPAHEFLCLYVHDGSPEARSVALERFPAIAAAEALRDDPSRREPLMILTLGNCTLAEIARSMALDETIVEAWQCFFFDIAAAREAVGWIVAHVIMPEQRDGNNTFAAKLRAAHAGGSAVARQIVDSDASLPLAQGHRLFDRQLRLELKYHEALELPLDSPRHQLQFLAFCHRLELDRERLELDRQKFEFHCEEIRRNRQRADALRQRQADEQQRRRDDEEQLQRDLRRAQEEAAELRAALSPLAELRWHSSAAVSADPGRRAAAPDPSIATSRLVGSSADRFDAAEWSRPDTPHELAPFFNSEYAAA